MDKEQVISILQNHYNKNHFLFDYDDEKQQFVVHRKLMVPNKETKIPEERDIHCIEFVLDHSKKELIIKLILNCSIGLESIGRGKDIIDKIIAFSKDIGYKAIIEYDVSKFSVHGVEFSLRKLKLLSTGKTWYQSLGFYEENYSNNKACIDKYITEKKVRSGKSVKVYYSEIMNELSTLSKRHEISPEEKKDLEKKNTNINAKFREMEKECSTIYKNYSDLVYSDEEPTYVKSSVSNSSSSTKLKKRSRSLSTSKKSNKSKKRRAIESVKTLFTSR